MAFDPFSLITIPLTWVADKALKHSTKKHSKHSSSKKAIRGDSPFEQGSFDNLLRTELLNLSESRALPMELRSQQFREWLQSEEIVPLFARVFWARWAEREDISKSVEEQLAINYEQNTGETRKLAAGRIRLAIDYVYGQLKATDDRQHIFQTALTQYCVGQIYSLTEIGPPKVPGEGDLPLFRSMAKGMLYAGKHIWRLPQIVAPLDLEMRVQDNDEAHQISISKLIRDVEFGENIILYGLGGIGKTTLALTMCESCLGREKRIPLYVDVAAWASKDIALFEYIEVLPAAKSNGITSAMLTKLAEIGKLVIILNGWNEVSAKSKRDCGRVLTELKVAAEALNIVVVSRSDKDIPTFNYSKKIEVRGLSWEGQQKIVSEELDEKLAGSLLDFLGRDNHFRHSARSPLILRGLISYFSRGETPKI
jgi:predicted NACHT family NTPase